MDLETYMPLAIRTEIDPQSVLDNLTWDGSDQGLNTRMANVPLFRLLHGAVGVAGEAGEITEQYDLWKTDTRKRKLDIEHISMEIGDTYWYLAVIRSAYHDAFEENGLMGYATRFANAKTGPLIRALEITSANLLDFAKRAVFYGQKVTYDDIRYNVHAVEGALNCLAMNLGLDIEKIRRQNIAKLAVRYPDKYTDQAALNRDLDREKKAIAQSAGEFDEAVRGMGDD